MILILTECDQKVAENNEKSSDSTIKYSQVYKTFDESECASSSCAQIKITQIEANGNHRINRFIEDKLSEIILGFTKKNKATALELMAQTFFSEYKEFKMAFPESRTPWTINIKMEADWLSENKGWMSLKFETYSYTGGAHPNTYTEYVNISEKGKLLRTREWIKDKKAFNEVAEKAFRSSQKIGSTESLGDAGFTFENDRFALPENIGRSKNQLILYYNDYEISSYAEGPTVVNIPLQDLEGIIEL